MLLQILKHLKCDVHHTLSIVPVWVVKLVRAGGKGECCTLSFPESKQDVLHGATAGPVSLQEDNRWMRSPPLGSGRRFVFRRLVCIWSEW